MTVDLILLSSRGLLAGLPQWCAVPYSQSKNMFSSKKKKGGDILQESRGAFILKKLFDVEKTVSKSH